MCLGIPMQVLEHDGTSALCERRGERRRVSLLLVGDVARGTHLLVHVATAIRVLDAEEAALVDDAVRCLEAASEGRPIDAFFSDLTSREPELPPHLRHRGPA
ncbi:MAG TPA: HypC/HybG/HupF family hydrogenase formation chaperone, partial [Labilithrix sp.]|nr:HypC/HybG/HupF family hydrogenase formation chaperone [Labilithrix sp.]